MGSEGKVKPREQGEVEDCFLRYRESGDREALARSLTLVQGELRRVARFYSLHPSEEDDVVQATVLTAIERAGAFDAERRLTPWLIGILLKKIASARRKAWRVSPELEIKTDRTPMNTAEAAEVRELVTDALAQLPAPYRDVLTLHLSEGKGGREIAAELHRPQGTIRAQIHRGMRLLRASLPAGLSLGLLGLFRRPASAQHAANASRTAAGPAHVAQPVLRAWVVPAAVIGGLALVAAVAWSVMQGDSQPVRAAGGPRPDTIATVDRDAGGRDAAPLADTSATERLTLSSSQELLTSVGPSLDVRVYERTSGAALTEVEVFAHVELESGERLDLLGTTDDLGLSSFAVDPVAIERLVLELRRAGFAALAASWDRSQGDFQVDERLEVPLHVARAIGGRVVDESGSPIAGAEIRLATWELANGNMWKLGTAEHLSVTDANGRWIHENAPEHGARINLRIFHADFATDLEVRRPLATEKLWALEHETVLKPGGPPVEVIARDAAGAPVADAVVTLSTTRKTPRRTLAHPVDSAGRMRFRWPDLEALVVSVRAPGRASRHVRLAEPPSAPLEIRIVEHTEFDFRVVDERGEPLAGLLVRPFGTTWREAARADPDGHFQLGLDPDRSLQIDFRKSGVIGTASVIWRPGTEHVLVVPDPVRLTGTLRDAATGEPLASARLAVHEGRARIGVHAVLDPAAYELPFWPRMASFFVEVSALGYEPQRSPELFADAPELTWNPALAPVDVIDELVLDRDGVPVDWGEACVVRPGALPVLVNGTLREELSPARKIRLKGDGRLTLNRPPEPFALVLVTRGGFAFVKSHELDARSGIHVEPMGRLEGSCALENGEPETVRLAFDRFSPDADGLGLGLRFSATTAPDGSFRFRGVPAGPVRVIPESRPDDALEAVVESGETASVSLR